MGSKAREMDKKIMNAFLKQDTMEKNLGYRISGSGQPVDSRGVKVNDVSSLLPTDYRTALAKDNIQRNNMANEISKSVNSPAGNTSTRAIYTQDEIRKIESARQNPEGNIIGKNDEVLKAVLDQNKMLMEEIKILRKSTQINTKPQTPQRIIRKAPKIR